MTQFPHDDFVKEYLPELCNDYGTATPSLDVKSETRQIDVFFIPDKPVPTTPETLGLLGKLTQQTCLFEVYRNPVQPGQIRECISKLFNVHENETRKAKREKSPLNSSQLPRLWILSPTVSPNTLREFKATPKNDWIEGVYFPPRGLFTGIVGIHQLPVTRETLWLRILGRGRQQARAIQELKSLPDDYYHKDGILELVYGLLETLATNQRKSQKIESEDKELMMSLRTVFREKLAQEKEEGMQQGIQQGMQQGIQQGMQQEINLVIRLLKSKIGDLAPELERQVKNLPLDKLENLGVALLKFESVENLTAWLQNN